MEAEVIWPFKCKPNRYGIAGTGTLVDEKSAIIFLGGVIGGLLAVQGRRIKEEPMILHALLMLGLPNRYVGIIEREGGNHAQQANDKVDRCEV